jgi:hypothetical protein
VQIDVSTVKGIAILGPDRVPCCPLQSAKEAGPGEFNWHRLFSVRRQHAGRDRVQAQQGRGRSDRHADGASAPASASPSYRSGALNISPIHPGRDREMAA